jgi:hypothetical protein
MNNETSLSILEEIQSEALTIVKPTALDLFNRSIMDQAKDYPPPAPLMYLVQYGEKFPHRTKKSFSLQQGKQKSKKTTELAMEVAAYINPVPCGDNIFFECVEPGVVLFFDCEQGESYAARTMKLILKLANLTISDKLIYCDLRILTPKERMSAIEAGIEATQGIKWVIIDGIVDVMNDFMSAEEGHLVITNLLTLCSKYDIHVTGVLHQNKGISKDARAHVGSIAGQKCEVEVMVERSNDDPTVSMVSAKEHRGLPFEDFAIKWEKGGLPHIVQGVIITKTEAKRQENDWTTTEPNILFSVVLEVFSHGESFGYSKLLPQMKIAYKKITGKHIGDNKMKDIITYCRNNFWLIQSGDKQPYTIGTYSIPGTPY